MLIFLATMLRRIMEIRGYKNVLNSTADQEISRRLFPPKLSVVLVASELLNRSSTSSEKCFSSGIGFRYLDLKSINICGTGWHGSCSVRHFIRSTRSELCSKLLQLTSTTLFYRLSDDAGSKNPNPDTYLTIIV